GGAGGALRAAGRGAVVLASRAQPSPESRHTHGGRRRQGPECMSAWRDDLTAGFAIVRRDLRITLSYRARFATHVLSVFFTLTLFHFISRLVRVSTFPTPDAYYAFAVVGVISLQVLNSTLHVPPGALRQEL